MPVYAPDKEIIILMSATESNTKRLGFLPNLCSLKAILRVAIAAEVLAMVLALAAAAETYQASL